MTESTYVPNPADWSDPENHIGGFYELEINLGPASEDRMSPAVEPLWAAAALGRSVRRDGVNEWLDAEPSLNVLLDGSLSGAVEIPGLGRTLWRVLAFRESLFDDDGELIGYGEEALVLGLPLGALGRLDPRVGAYPFGDVSNSEAWRGSQLSAAARSSCPMKKGNSWPLGSLLKCLMVKPLDRSLQSSCLVAVRAPAPGSIAGWPNWNRADRRQRLWLDREQRWGPARGRQLSTRKRFARGRDGVDVIPR